MKNTMMIVLATCSLLSSFAANASDISFLKSDSPIAKRGNLELYLYAGDFGKPTESPYKCWMLLEIQRVGEQAEIIGLSDMTFNNTNLSGSLKLSVKQSEENKVRLTVSQPLVRKTQYSLSMDTSNHLSSYSMLHHDSVASQFVLDGPIEDFSVNCNNLSNISQASKIPTNIWGPDYVKENIQDFEQGYPKK